MGPEETVVLVTCLIWILSEVFGSRIVPALRGRGTVKVKGDRGSSAIIWLTIFVSITVVVNLEATGITGLPEWCFELGLAMMIGGIVLRQWAIFVLGRFFSTKVRILTDHRIVTNGPYSVVRHPSYTGALFTLVGFGLASRTWAGTLVILILSGLVYGYRISIEEKALKAEFGEQYLDYSRRTKRLIPLLF